MPEFEHSARGRRQHNRDGDGGRRQHNSHGNGVRHRGGAPREDLKDPYSRQTIPVHVGDGTLAIEFKSIREVANYANTVQLEQPDDLLCQIPTKYGRIAENYAYEVCNALTTCNYEKHDGILADLKNYDIEPYNRTITSETRALISLARYNFMYLPTRNNAWSTEIVMTCGLIFGILKYFKKKQPDVYMKLIASVEPATIL
jgi:hypothetical protein